MHSFDINNTYVWRQNDKKSHYVTLYNVWLLYSNDSSLLTPGTHFHQSYTLQLWLHVYLVSYNVLNALYGRLTVCVNLLKYTWSQAWLVFITHATMKPNVWSGQTLYAFSVSGQARLNEDLSARKYTILLKIGHSLTAKKLTRLLPRMRSKRHLLCTKSKNVRLLCEFSSDDSHWTRAFSLVATHGHFCPYYVSFFFWCILLFFTLATLFFYFIIPNYSLFFHIFNHPLIRLTLHNFDHF